MADLTRFDFNAKNFLTSESVRRMTDAEVGQYILLLAEAWLCGRDATLPDDLPYLARLAHTDKVSERVLEKFPIVETSQGPRRQNPVLYDEWIEALKRSESARERVAARGGKWAETAAASKSGVPVLIVGRKSVTEDDTDEDTTVSSPVIRETLPKPNQAVPDQTKPNCTSNISSNQAFSENPQNLGGDWGNIRSIHKRFFGTKPDKNRFGARYESACRQYSEDVVLACLNQWIASVGEFVKANFEGPPLNSFFKKLPDLAVDEIESREEDKLQAAERAREQEREKERAKETNEIVAAQIREDVERWSKVPEPEPGASVLEYLPELEANQNAT